ncbi:hypothetical protein N9Y23_08535 [Pseudomonadales bacterium]|nr:hypothetical protein [Pseudomonadales bacterium]MDB2596350.1 hypothetical protein [Pseudomonadales bacterium]
MAGLTDSVECGSGIGKWYRLVIGTVLGLLLSSCASNLDQGNASYAIGQYDRAAQYWNVAAAAGEPAAQYNLGLLWEQGLGSTPRNADQGLYWYYQSAQRGYVPGMVKAGAMLASAGRLDEAVSWFTLAARWGNMEAVNNLRVLNARVPAADLMQMRARETEQANLMVMDAAMKAASKVYMSTLP